jgi:HEPN domain-containing protein
MKNDHEKLAQNWFTIAEDDLQSARVLIEDRIYRNACFHCQQAVEKYMKGLMVARGIKYPKIHDLLEFNQMLVEHGISVSVSLDNLELLDSFYIEPRYPDAYFEVYTKKEAQEALQTADRIIKEIKKFL